MRKSIIRTAIKNENLLAKKMESLRVKKNTKKTSSLKHKLQRSSKLDGVLGTKIEQSIARARFVQGSRKAGWEQINKSLTVTITSSKQDEKPLKERDAIDMMDDDSEPELEAFELPTSVNSFAVLEETEA